MKAGVLRFIFYTVLLLKPIFSDMFILQEPLIDHIPLAKAVLHIIENYIGPKTNTLIIKKFCMNCNDSSQQYHDRLFNHIVRNINTSLPMLLQKGDISEDRSWKYTVFIVDSAKSFENQLNETRKKFYEREFHFLIVFTHTKDLSHSELILQMKDIIQIGLNFFVINVAILVEKQNGALVLYRSDILGPDCGHSISMILYNRFRNGILLENCLFPSRMLNFDNCSLNVIAHETAPLLIFKGDKHNQTHLSDSTRLEGIEGYILRSIERALNFKIKMRFSNEKSKVLSNGTGLGCFAMLDNGTAHVAIGSFGAVAPQRNFFTASISYYQTPAIFVIRSGIKCSPIRQLFQAFSQGLWSMIATTLLVGIALMRLFKLLANKRFYASTLGNEEYTATLSIFATLLGSPLTRLPSRNFSRILLIFWILFAMVLRSAYQGKMFDSLRVSRRISLPRSYDDLVRRGYVMLANDYQEYYPHNLTNIVKAEYLERYQILENTDETKRLTSASLVATLAHYNRYHRNSRLTMVNDPVFIFQIVMYFKKHSRFKFIFDLKLKQLMSSGIISYMANHYIKQKYLHMNDQPLSFTQISNKMLYGLYTIYGGLIALTIFVFVLELLSLRSRKLRFVFMWLHYYN